jgi:pimeloyl-ACP methyl ester carboxylesterase
VIVSSLPAPTGRYRVGRRSFHWIDAERREPNGDPRELVVWVWYPAQPEASTQEAEYLPSGWEAVGGFWGFRAAGLTSHSFAGAPVIAGSSRYPVLIFSPAGFPPLMLSALLEELASHGYVVCGINHTYESAVSVFPDGRVIPMDSERMQPALGPFSGDPRETFQKRAAIADRQAADIGFVAGQIEALATSNDPLRGHLDLERLAAFGHSLGGNAALEFARVEPRCLAAVNLDGGVWSSVGQMGLDRPTLQLLADHAEMALPCPDIVQAGAYPSIEWCEAERDLTIGAWQTLFESGRPGSAVLIRGSGHISFMDLPFLPLEPGSIVAGGMATVKIDASRAWRLISDVLLGFFGEHLRTPSGPFPAAPEIALGAPRELIGSR